MAVDRIQGATVPTLRHDDVRNELLSGFSESGRRQYEAFGAVEEARHVTARLAELRQSANLSQRQAAKRAGVDQADLSRIESGKVTPSLPTLLRLLDAVGGTLIVARRRSAPVSAEEAPPPSAQRTKGSGAANESVRQPRGPKKAQTRTAASASKAVRRSA
jgi:transcriptional regulator with XRE-family HTH domain